MRKSVERTHPVLVVQRISAALLGLFLCAFAGLAIARGQPFFFGPGQLVWGLSSNGALSTLSLVAGAVLLGAAAWSGPAASAVTAAMGVVFLLSGLVHLGLLHTPWNILAFQLPNVFFSLAVGVVLLVMGFYGRVSGGLPPDNPYRRAHPIRKHRPDPDEQLQAQAPVQDPQQRAILEAEIAVAEGHATAEQNALVQRQQARTRASYYRRPGQHGQ